MSNNKKKAVRQKLKKSWKPAVGINYPLIADYQYLMLLHASGHTVDELIGLVVISFIVISVIVVVIIAVISVIVVVIIAVISVIVVVIIAVISVIVVVTFVSIGNACLQDWN